MEKLNSKIKLFTEDDPDKLADLTICYGNNESSLVSAFYQRYKFKEDGTPVLLPPGFDFLATGCYYGKVDTKGRAVIPKKESLIKVDSKFAGDEEIYLNKTLYALYVDFFEQLKLDFAIGKFDIDQFLNVFSIQQAGGSYEDLQESYKDDTSDVLNDIYLTEVVPNTTNVPDLAGDFKTYLSTILRLFERGKIDKSVLYSEYFLSGANVMTNSGLAFEIRNTVPYDDDFAKFNEYYRYPLYGRIICFLFLNGLRYDANVPWRFVMDLNLEATVKMLGGKSKQDFFDANFELVEGTVTEMEMFYEAIYLSYLKLLDTVPLYYTNTQKWTCEKNGAQLKTTTTSSFTRKLFSQRQYDTFMEENFASLLYAYASTLNSVFKRRGNISTLLLDLSNKVKKGLDKEALVRYTFNKMKYC